MQIVESTEIRGTDGGNINSAFGTANRVYGEGFTPVVDSRLGPGGVVHPVTDIRYNGTNTNWFGAATPGMNGAKTMIVGYRRGTGRAPQINSYSRNDGCWVMGWAIKLDIGVKALDYRGLIKSVGA